MAASRGRGDGSISPPPPVRRKNGQNQPFSENFWIFAPYRILPPRCPPPQNNFWCRHCGKFVFFSRRLLTRVKNVKFPFFASGPLRPHKLENKVVSRPEVFQNLIGRYFSFFFFFYLFIYFFASERSRSTVLSCRCPGGVSTLSWVRMCGPEVSTTTL